MMGRRAASNALPNTLGELELLVMEVLWKHPHLDAREIADRLSGRKRNSLSTIQSTLERLYRKQLLDRIKQGHAYTYHASVSRPRLLGRMMSDVIHLLHDGRMDTILSSFVNVAADLDVDSLESLERLIEEKKKLLEASEKAGKEESDDAS